MLYVSYSFSRAPNPEDGHHCWLHLGIKKWSSREAWHLIQGHSAHKTQPGFKLQPPPASLLPFIPLPVSEVILVEPAPSSHQASCVPPRTMPFSHLTFPYLTSSLPAGGQRAPWLKASALRANGRESC